MEYKQVLNYYMCNHFCIPYILCAMIIKYGNEHDTHHLHEE